MAGASSGGEKMESMVPLCVHLENNEIIKLGDRRFWH